MFLSSFKRILLQLAFVFFFLSSAHTAYSVPLSLEDKSFYTLSGYWEILTDPTRDLSVQQAVGRSDWSGPVNEKILNLGITKSAIWVRFFLSNATDTSRKFYVSFEYPAVNSVSFYSKSSRGVFQKEQTGSSVLASANVIPYRHYLFPLVIEAGETIEVYMRMQSYSGMTIPIRILSDQALFQKTIRDYALYGSLFGFLALVLVYFIAAGSFMHKKASLWLAAYSALFGIHIAARAGFIRLFTPDGLLGINDLFHLVAIGGLYFTGAKFFRLFLSLKTISRPLDLIMAGFQYMSILFVALALFPNPFLTVISFILFVINPLFSICLAFYFWRRGVSNAGYFAIGWILAHLVSVYDFFRINGIISYPAYNEWLIPFSLLIALIFLSVALIRQNAIDHLMAETDPLTRLANRRKFDEALYEEWNRCLREQSPLSLIMVDVDHFKNYNDAFGHKAGDQYLCYLADVLKRYTQRSGELAVRYGGEEFVLLLPKTDATNAFNLAEAIRNYLGNSAEDTTNHAPGKKTTISLGVATTIPKKEEKPEILVLEADIALYEAKRAGRNRTIASSAFKT
jgi:diguanylate cyclase (GGDEF)-like protein